MNTRSLVRMTTLALLSAVCTGLAFVGAASPQRVTYELRTAAGVQAHVISARLGPDTKVTATVARGSATYNAESFGSMLARTQPTAAVNGTAFSRQTLKPIGDIVADHRLLNSGLMGTALCIATDGTACLRRVTWGHAEDWSAYETVMACGPTLLKDGQVDLDPAGEKFHDPAFLGSGSHCACGLTGDSRLVLVSVTRGTSLQQMARVMLALQCREAMLLDGGASAAMYYRGRVVISPGRALTNLLLVYEDRTKAPAARPAEECYALGMKLKRDGQASSALAQMQQAIALQPDYRDAHWALAWLLAESGRRAEARAEFRRVLELAPTPEQKRGAEAALSRLQTEGAQG